MKAFFKRNKIELLSFIIPMLLLIIIFGFNEKAPIGKHIVMLYDGSLQYPGFASIFSEFLKGNTNILYSFTGALGFNLFANVAYYLLNPTNLFLVFFNSINLDIFYMITVILKVGLCGLICSILLKSKAPGNKYNILFACAYALTTYNLVYYFNFMWFDSIVLFPLVVLGIEKLIYQNKKALYVISLTLSIISNFYIGYMICIFSLLYFIYKFILLPKKERKFVIIKRFIICSLISGLICAFVIIPVAYELFQGKASMYSNDNYTNYFALNENGLKSFYRFMPGSFTKNDIAYGSQNIYSTLFVLVLSIYFFFNKNISKKEKIVTGCFIGFYLIGFGFNLIDYSWQLFQRPIWYPSRYVFTLSLLLILVAHRSFNNTDIIKTNELYKIIAGFILICLVILGALYSDVFKELKMSAEIVFLILSIFLLIQYFYVLNNKKFIYFAIFLFIIEIMANGIFNVRILNNFNKTNEFREELTFEKEAVDKIKELEGDNSFYRMDIKPFAVINSGMVHDYNGISYFSSLRNNNAMEMLSDFGFKIIDGCSVRTRVDNPVINSIIAMKYYVVNKEQFYYDYVPRNTESDFKIYSSDDTYGIATLVNENLMSTSLSSGDIITNTRLILSNVLNKNYNEVLKEIKPTSLENVRLDSGIYYKNENVNNSSGYIVYDIPVSQSGFYIFREIAKNNFIYAYINGKEYNLNDYDTSVFVSEGDSLTLKLQVGSSTSSLSINPYFLPYDIYDEFVTKIQKNQLDIIEYKQDNYIRGKVLVNDENYILMTSIPYDKGWSISVDGNEVEYQTIFEHLIALPLEKGEHIIEFSYSPVGLKLGTIISTISTLFGIIYLNRKKA